MGVAGQLLLRLRSVCVAPFAAAAPCLVPGQSQPGALCAPRPCRCVCVRVYAPPPCCFVCVPCVFVFSLCCAHLFYPRVFLLYYFFPHCCYWCLVSFCFVLPARLLVLASLFRCRVRSSPPPFLVCFGFPLSCGLLVWTAWLV